MRMSPRCCLVALLLAPAFASAGLITNDAYDVNYGLWNANDLSQFQFISGNDAHRRAISSEGFGWMHYTYSVSAPTASRSIYFSFYNRPNFRHFDAVAVTEVAIAAVPEPATLWLAAAALLGLGALRRRAA